MFTLFCQGRLGIKLKAKSHVCYAILCIVRYVWHIPNNAEVKTDRTHGKAMCSAHLTNKGLDCMGDSHSCSNLEAEVREMGCGAQLASSSGGRLGRHAVSVLLRGPVPWLNAVSDALVSDRQGRAYWRSSSSLPTLLPCLIVPRDSVPSWL